MSSNFVLRQEQRLFGLHAVIVAIIGVYRQAAYLHCRRVHELAAWKEEAEDWQLMASLA